MCNVSNEFELSSLSEKVIKKIFLAKTSCNISNEFELSNICEYVIKKILLSLDTTDAVGMDQILAKLLKDGAEELALPLTNTINLSNYHPSQRSVKLLS